MCIVTYPHEQLWLPWSNEQLHDKQHHADTGHEIILQKKKFTKLSKLKFIYIYKIKYEIEGELITDLGEQFVIVVLE